MEGKFKKAGIIIIGNEILNGHVRDTNSSFICKRFHAIGVKVCRIVSVPDEIEDIAEEVARFSEKFDFVITTGGIGPTHDDITYEAVAKGMNDKIILNTELADVIKSYFNGNSNVQSNPALKMAMIPESSKLIYILPKSKKEYIMSERQNGLQPMKIKPKKAFPIVQIKNVYVLPGMTEWLEHAFDQLQKVFENPEVEIYTMVMFLRSHEFSILHELNKAVAKFQNQVIFGSYPSHSSNKEFGTKITLEGTSVDDVTAAYSFLKCLLPQQTINDVFQRKDAELVYELTNGNKSLNKAVRNSLKVIEAALREYKSDEIYVSFNGGKDCTVLVHLVWAVNVMLDKEFPLNTVHIKGDTTFPEVDSFILETIERYNLRIETVHGQIKAALMELHKQKKNIKGFFMGTRRTDPFSESMEEFQMCDKDWPPLMRVNPILDWSYENIWDFLRILAVPYCCLYDEGYTSIGTPKNTLPNPALKIPKDTGKNTYLPAYRLKDGSLERQGRI